MSDYDRYDETEKTGNMHDRTIKLLPWLKLSSRALPLVAILFCIAYLLSQRGNLFPESVTESEPPLVQTIGFPSQRPPVSITKKDHKTTDKPEPRSTSSAVTGNGDTPTVSSRTSSGTTGRPNTTSSTATSTRPASGTVSTTTGSTGTTPTTTTTGDTSGASATTASGNTTPPPAQIDWSKKEITGPVEGAYIAIFLSRKVVALVVGRQYARIYYYASIPANAQPGNYRITDHKLNRRVMTLILNYPSTEDAAQALSAGKITRQQYDAIASAQKAQKKPPFNTPLGGPLGLRGDGGNNTPAKGQDFGITSQQMEELWLAVRKGTVVRIVK